MWHNKKGKNQILRAEDNTESMLLYDLILINDGFDLFLMFCSSKNLTNYDFWFVLSFGNSVLWAF